MFSGAGIYAGQTIFAIAVDGVIYLKADERTLPAFKREGLAPFTYQSKKKRVAMSYWRVPDRLYDNPEELALWSRDAMAAAQRAAAGKTRLRP
jgi:DNA transformation protein